VTKIVRNDSSEFECVIALYDVDSERTRLTRCGTSARLAAPNLSLSRFLGCTNLWHQNIANVVPVRDEFEGSLCVLLSGV
jgi:hypothetical protein